MTPTDKTDAPDAKAAARPNDAFWAAVVDDIRTGRLWNAEAKRRDGQPVERLEAAMAGLPRAGAFKEAAIATRGIIRNRLKENSEIDRHLGLLYWLAAVDAHPADESERAALTGDRLYSVVVDYDRLGHANLGLLNKTDRGWLTDRWGEPAAPTTVDAARADGTVGTATPAPSPSPSSSASASASAPAAKAASAADHAGDAAHKVADAAREATATVSDAATAVKEKASAAGSSPGGTASAVKKKASSASYETGRAAQRTRIDLERAGRWIGSRLGNHHPAGSDERKFAERQDVVLVAIGGLIVLLLLLAIIF